MNDGIKDGCTAEFEAQHSLVFLHYRVQHSSGTQTVHNLSLIKLWCYDLQHANTTKLC